MSDQMETPKAGINRWNFSGKVIKKNFKFSKDGVLYGSVMVRIPSKNEKFSTVMWLKAFNSKDGVKKLADQINDEVAEDTNWSFYGYVSNNKFEKVGEDGKTLTDWRTDFIVTKCIPALEAEQVVVKAEDPAPF